MELGKQRRIIEVTRRIRVGWISFGKMNNMLNNKDVPIGLRKRIFDSYTVPVLTYSDKIRNTNKRSRAKVTAEVQEMAKLKWNWGR